MHFLFCLFWARKQDLVKQHLEYRPNLSRQNKCSRSKCALISTSIYEITSGKWHDSTLSTSSLTMLSYCEIYSEASLPCRTYLRYFKEYLDEKIPLKLWKIVVIKRLRNSSYTPVYDVRPKLLLWFPQHIICPLYSISIQCFSICRLHAIQYNIGYFTLKKVIWCCWYGKKKLWRYI